MFICVLLKLGLDWEKTARRNFEDLLEKGDRTLHSVLSASGQFTRGEQMQHRSDRTLHSVLSASGVKVILHPVKR